MSDTPCNLCGLSCVIGPQGSPARGPAGLIGAQVVGGYESTPGNGHGALDDMVRYTFNLCEFCLDWLFARFNVPVKTDDPMNDYVLKDGETVEEGMARMGVVRVVGHCETEPWKPAEQRVADWEARAGGCPDPNTFRDEKARRDKARGETQRRVTPGSSP